MKHLHLHPTARWSLMLALLSTIVALSTIAPAVQPARAGSITPGITISADISINTTWTAANSPYIISLPINVANTATLTIEPGASILDAWMVEDLHAVIPGQDTHERRVKPRPRVRVGRLGSPLPQ